MMMMMYYLMVRTVISSEKNSGLEIIDCERKIKQKKINQAMEMNESTEKEEKGQRTGRIPSPRD